MSRVTKVLRKRDVLAVAASGEAASFLHGFLLNLREDVVSAIATDNIYHKTVFGRSATSANATNTATAVALINELKAKINEHIVNYGLEGAHRAASAAPITVVNATDEATAITLANDVKAKFNTHLAEAGVHIKNDAANAVASADATNAGTLNTLVNEIKVDYNNHIGVGTAMTTPVVTY